MANTSNPELRQALSDALETVHLEAYLEAACTWCEENGAWGLDELAAEDVFPDFAKDIGLKRLQVKRLLQAFDNALGKESSPSNAATASSKDPSFSPAFAPPPTGFFPGNGGLRVVVKNTFLEERPSQSELAGNRANTLPVSFPRDDAEDEEDAEDVAENELSEAGSEGILGSPLPSTGSAGLLTKKLVTFDAWESGAYWDWEEENRRAAGLPAKQAAEPATCEAAGAGQVNPNLGYMPTPMWGMPPMMFPMMPMGMPMDANIAAQAQMQMAMGGMMMAQNMEPAGPVADPKPRSQVMERVFSMASQRERIRWTVDARKLKSSDREAVSPTFEVSCGAQISFKMVLKPKVMDSNKGGACFKKSRNKGYVELRCVTDLENAGLVKPSLTFRLQVASERKSEPFRGPVRHNFADRAICGLPEGQDEWDFGKVVDHNNNTFGVVLELLKDDS